MGFFDKFLSLWVALCIALGVLIGILLPGVPGFLGGLEYAGVNIPIAVLIWLMILPMMMKIDFSSLRNVGRKPKGLVVTLVMNWLIKPFTMYGLSYLFFRVIFRAFLPPELANEYLAGAVLLGAAPCTAMVFVWSALTKGDSAYTLVQVAINDLILIVAYAPIVMFLLSLGSVPVPADTVLFSVVVFVVLPLAAGWLFRWATVRRRGLEWFTGVLLPKVSVVTPVGLLLTLVMIFSLQGQTLVDNLLHILLIALPLVIQTFLIFGLAYLWARVWKIPHCISAPAGMIGASNFFELAVAVAVAVFGVNSGAALATVVGVLVEVPVMLALVRFANRTRSWWPEGLREGAQ
ncbi:ACR3 family arsenite efflux transporter [Spirochaeta lutea]|uniref:Arsenic transporter n=1 Tax=Spirochaeta lutea TaxID=1480694 RepID=A0A098QY65_9SPIO|nr:ACR3 family arsenite efflux transporter [Spirochaeta lutea]KGE72644.1 arsenic transporter [Spirochaeta lutea]